MRSQLWHAETWPTPDALPSVAQLCKVIQNPDGTLDELEEHYAPEHYNTLLY
jgi:hypothetical protein